MRPADRRRRMTAAVAQGGGAVVAGGGALVWTATANPAPNVSAAANPTVFSGVSIGASSADRIVALMVTNIGAGVSDNAALTTATIDFGSGDTPMTLAATSTPPAAGSKYQNSIYYLAVPAAATTATFKVSTLGGAGWSVGMAIAVGTIKGSASASHVSANDVTTTTQYPHSFTFPDAATVTIPSGGLALFSGVADSGSSDTFNWGTGITKDYDQYFLAGGSGTCAGSAHASATVAASVDFSNHGGGMGWIAAVFQP